MQVPVSPPMRPRPMIMFPVALLAIVLCGAVVTLAPEPGAKRVTSAYQDPAAAAASPLIRAEGSAAR